MPISPISQNRHHIIDAMKTHQTTLKNQSDATEDDRGRHRRRQRSSRIRANRRHGRRLVDEKDRSGDDDDGKGGSGAKVYPDIPEQAPELPLRSSRRLTLQVSDFFGLQQQAPAQRRCESRCNHITMTRLYGKALRCKRCMCRSPFGWVYRCSADREVLLQEAKAKGVEVPFFPPFPYPKCCKKTFTDEDSGRI